MISGIEFLRRKARMTQSEVAAGAGISVALLGRLSVPYHTIKPAVDSKTWHDHVCLALWLGPEVYEAFCPYAMEQGFASEVDDRCEQCECFSTIYASDGKLRLVTPAACGTVTSQ